MFFKLNLKRGLYRTFYYTLHTHTYICMYICVYIHNTYIHTYIHTQDDLELLVSLPLPAGVTGVHHHVQFIPCWEQSPGSHVGWTIESHPQPLLTVLNDLWTCERGCEGVNVCVWYEWVCVVCAEGCDYVCERLVRVCVFLCVCTFMGVFFNPPLHFSWQGLSVLLEFIHFLWNDWLLSPGMLQSPLPPL